MNRVNKKTVSKNNKRSDRTFQLRVVYATIIIVLLITSLPYLYAYITAPDDKQFMGIILNVPDHFQYFSWMSQLSKAHLAKNMLTPEANDPVFFNLLWWGLGRFGRFINSSYIAMYHTLRVVATVLFLLLAFRFCSWYFKNHLMILFSFFLVTFAGGFGWILILLKYIRGSEYTTFPLLVYISEPNTFFNIISFPHFLFAALYIFVFDLILRGQKVQQLRYAFAAGFFALLMGFQHAYDLILIYGTIASYAVLTFFRDRAITIYIIKCGIIIGCLSIWPAVYSILLTSYDPIWKDVLEQFKNAGVYTPNPILLPILLGPTFIIAVFTFFKQGAFHLKSLEDKQLFIKAWFIANLVLIYIPTDFQVHMLNGFQVPIAILATEGIFYYLLPSLINIFQNINWDFPRIQVKRFLLITIMLIAVPTNIYLYLWRFVELSRHDYPYYLYRDEVTALKWLNSNAKSDDVVLSSYTIGHYIPVISGSSAFLAHWAQTVNFYEKRKRVDTFYDAASPDDERMRTICNFGVDYVFHGPLERGIGLFEPNTRRWLQRVFSKPNVDVYRIKKIG